MAEISDIDLTRDRMFVDQEKQTQTNPNKLPHTMELKGTTMSRIPALGLFMISGYPEQVPDYSMVPTNRLQMICNYIEGETCDRCGTKLIRYDVQSLGSSLCDDCEENMATPLDYDPWWNYVRRDKATARLRIFADGNWLATSSTSLSSDSNFFARARII